MHHATTFIRQVQSSTTYHPNGDITITRDPAVWTLAHRGYSGCGRLDIWVYPTKALALAARAELAMACGMDEDPTAQALFDSGRYTALLQRYEDTHPETHLLRVQAAFLQDAPAASAEGQSPADDASGQDDGPT